MPTYCLLHLLFLKLPSHNLRMLYPAVSHRDRHSKQNGGRPTDGDSDLHRTLLSRNDCAITHHREERWNGIIFYCSVTVRLKHCYWNESNCSISTLSWKRLDCSGTQTWPDSGIWLWHLYSIHWQQCTLMTHELKLYWPQSYNLVWESVMVLYGLPFLPTILSPQTHLAGEWYDYPPVHNPVSTTQWLWRLFLQRHSRNQFFNQHLPADSSRYWLSLYLVPQW